MAAPTQALRRTRLAVAAGFFLQGLVFAAIVTQVPTLKDKIGLGDGDVTILLVVVALVSGVGSVFAGMIAERRTSSVAFRIALMTIALGALLVGLAPNKPLLVAAFVLYGLGVGGVDASMNMQGVRVQAAYGRSVMANFHGVWSVAGIAGALYASGVTKLDIPLGVSLAAIAATTFAIALLASRFFVDAREVEVGLSGEDVDVPWRPILIFGLVIVVFYAADTGILTWSSVYLHDALDATKSVAPLAFAAYETGAIVSRFGGDFLVRRRGAAFVVRLGAATGIAGLVGVVAAPAIAANERGARIARPRPTTKKLAMASRGAGAVGPSAVNVAIARLNIANYVGAILGGALIGAAASTHHLRWAFVIPLVIVPAVLLVAKAFSVADVAEPTAQ
ncbi:MAG TPA: MFS transporter [Aeromicrobium sp.]|nr:MFS transporter [Aeromicrobium sp.]